MTAHSHPEYVPGCFRCDLSRDEVAAADRPLITCARCGRGIQPGGTVCCPLPKSGTHRWGATDTKEN